MQCRLIQIFLSVPDGFIYSVDGKFEDFFVVDASRCSGHEPYATSQPPKVLERNVRAFCGRLKNLIRDSSIDGIELDSYVSSK